MSDRFSATWSVEDVNTAVNSEGLGYMILHYLPAEKIEDKELFNAWRQAQVWLEKIEEILEPYNDPYNK